MLPAWRVILSALGTEPQAIHEIRGASGFPHSIVAAGIDKNRRRLVVISPEADPRVAAMVQADLQAADNSMQVVTTRPILLDVTAFNDFFSGIGKTEVTREEMWEFALSQKDKIDTRGDLLSQFSGEGPGQISLAHSAESMMLQMMAANPPEQSPFIAERAGNPVASELANSKIDLAVTVSGDILAGDRAAGICPLPLCHFSDLELEVILAGTEPEAVKEILRSHGVDQYFFPSPDYVALGLIERDPLPRKQIDERLVTVPSLGHPYVEPELVSANTSLRELIDALREKHLVVEGEVSVEVTPEGKAVRSTVRFKPGESLFAKLINRFSITLDLKDLFKL